MAVTKQTGWSAAEDQLLRQLFAEGETFSQIAKEISVTFMRPVSRNATIGRAHRLGLNGRKVVYTPEQRREKSKQALAKNNISRQIKRTLNPINVLRRNGGTVTSVATFEQEAFTMRPDSVEPLRVSLVDLAQDCCHFPYGDSPFVFCGLPARPGLAYCAEHYRTTHNNAAPPTAAELEIIRRAHRAKLVAEVIAA